jgi:pimeloyl-ACP methyl ester carboxylesterase
MTKVLLVPGLLCDGHVWEATLSALAPMPAEVADVTTQPSIPAMATDLLARYPGPLIVVGHSMGGRVAMEMARQAPGRLLGMALLNTGMAPRSEAEMPGREAMIARAHREGMAALAAHWLPGMMAAGVAPDPAVIDGLTRMVCRMTPEIAERQILALIDRPDARIGMPDWRGPLLLMTGRLDVWSPVAQHEDIARLCPQARLEIIENAGHFAPVEQPAAVAALLSDWVRGLLAAPQEARA